MALSALVLYLVFGLLGFGWRSWTHHRRTGSTGFHGISGRPGSVEWYAGIAFVIAVLAGIAAPALQLAGVLMPLHPLDTPWIAAAGTVLAITGIAATIYAQYDMGESWRIGVDPGETTTLVRDGVFAIVRNPIFTAMGVFATGITLMAPNPLALIALSTYILAIELQVRVVEEPHLIRTHGDSYTNYTSTVGRFIPFVGRS
ncbi:isoprenylcysteine carboxylmethyltransferase family protein [Nocardia sp. CDC159]|uniref:Isoprenylcysteine carboxylmethyltransferase family protein n=1 Tax=Nocardia pulmonis TaxID=2951408 RepID=A0A9X2E2T0_9NOCA|nr:MULTISPECIES: isoprenylcysteine carboxylmethyltransferase family protein [Nocardia]MCM6773087.1 isoprenylcysteine carboxylmethyltransferase family protein [Nocardia pulmonis]MCM6785610.1 isoprenylcysteine carboxylmethyltransferase family protein [Nocardia sp. CDC159]